MTNDEPTTSVPSEAVRHSPFVIRHFLSLPLLTKELTEAAARRRTYVLRVVYAVLLYGLFALTVPRFFWDGSRNALGMLGAGRELFDVLLALEFAAIGLFLPALMCGRITEEKERDSLVLLFLTELRPWQIVLQKYLGGLVPMFTFLLLGLPLGAVAYAFGGLERSEILVCVWVLGLACLQLGALALACSAWCRTTVAAFVFTYLAALALYAGPVLLWRIVGSTILWLDGVSAGIGLNPVFALDTLRDRTLPEVRASGASLAPIVLVKSGQMLASIVLLLVLARVGLVRRAFAPPGHALRRLFRWLDAVMVRANRRFGNITIFRADDALPVHHPISWRERTRTGFGQPQHLVRILLVVEVPVLAMSFIGAIQHLGHSRGAFESFTLLAWVVAALFLAVQSANALVSERVQQSLEVLLTTPMSAAQIVVQKALALRRLALVLAIPLLTLGAAEWLVEWGYLGFSRHSYAERGDGPAAYVVCVLLSVFIYLPLFSWLALWIGLRARTRFKAIVTAVGVLAAWCGGVPLLVMLCLERVSLARSNSIFEYLHLLSPGCILALNEQSSIHTLGMPFDSAWPLLALNFLFYFHLLLFIRSLALARAERYLRR